MEPVVALGDWIRLVVEIETSDDGAPRGRVGAGDGSMEDFHGWTSLASAIERHRAAGAAGPGVPVAPAHQ